MDQSKAEGRGQGKTGVLAAGISRLSLARGDPAEKVSGAELGVDSSLKGAGRVTGERAQVGSCSALLVSVEGRVLGGQGWGGSPS